MFLPVITELFAPNTDSDSQLAKTAMSPAEHARNHLQRTAFSSEKGAGTFLPVIPGPFA